MHPDFHGVPAGDPFPQTFPRATPLTPDEINRDDAISLRLERMRAAGTSQRGKFVRTSTNDIMAKTFDPIKWVVPGYISEGFLGQRFHSSNHIRLPPRACMTKCE